MGSQDHAPKKLASNRKALFEYTVLERIEAGIELRGTEVKSVKGGGASLVGGFAREDAGQVWLHSTNIPPYEQGNRFNHAADRPRRLLLHKREIEKIAAKTQQKGFALVPLSLYLKRGIIKVELGLCKGKTHADKRDTLRRKDADKEIQRAVAAHR
jgi:SsrA-binding protein